MPASDLLQKDLKIKTGCVRRMSKELQMYRKEEVANRAVVDKMTAEGRCPHEIKQQVEVLNDTLVVIPNTKDRLESYIEELEEFLQEDPCQAVPETSDEPSDFEKQVFESREWATNGRDMLEQDEAAAAQ